MELPLGLSGVAFASAILPSVSRSVASSNYEEFRKTLSRSLSMVFLLTIPASVGLIVLGQPIVGVIYQGGKFQLYDTEQTAIALSAYAVGLVGYSAAKVLNPAFYALSDAKTPMYVSLLSIAVNFVVAEDAAFGVPPGHGRARRLDIAGGSCRALCCCLKSFDADSGASKAAISLRVVSRILAALARHGGHRISSANHYMTIWAGEIAWGYLLNLRFPCLWASARSCWFPGA